MTKQYRDKKWLNKQYWENGLSTREVAIIYNVHPTTIFYQLKKNNIKTRTISESKQGNKNHFYGKKHNKQTKENMNRERANEKHPNWKGGRRIDQEGYVLIRMNGKYVREHRVIAEEALKRGLKKGEIVHHVNGIKHDNKNKNLLICSKNYHRWFETKMAQLYMKEHFG